MGEVAEAQSLLLILSRIWRLRFLSPKVPTRMEMEEVLSVSAWSLMVTEVSSAVRAL